MAVSESIVHELRQLFKQGATPSRLLHHIIQRLPDELVTAWVLREYLEQAFCLPPVRLIRPGVDYSSANPSFVAFNRTIIPDIIQRRHEWDTEQDLAQKPIACWFDGLTSTPPDEARAAADQTTHPHLTATSWARLSTDEQDALRLQMAGVRTMSERVTLLAHLVERLQHRVEDLENQLDDVSISQLTDRD